MKEKLDNDVLEHWIKNLKPQFEFGMSLAIFVGGGLFASKEYSRFYNYTKQYRTSDVTEFAPLELYNSGDGYRAFLWLESCVKLIHTKEFIPCFIDVVCDQNYREEVRKAFGQFYNISEDSLLLTGLEKENVRKDNATYILESLDNLQELMRVNGNVFREITIYDMENIN
ncbi:hypothetical protein [Bacillus sp. FSL L8-0152]|uniref:hypothetical protein n=1 Tax=Bacillus sp. FSL L8-0152 TaxID=2921516 RepID=UPI0030F99544